MNLRRTFFFSMFVRAIYEKFVITFFGVSYKN